MPSNEWESRKSTSKRVLHERYEFIDQVRGLAVLFLTLAWVTIELGWKKLVPAIFTHGFIFYSDEPNVTWNWMQVGNYAYTWIDLGSSIFMILVGVTVPISFRSRASKDGTGMALMRLVLRYAVFVCMELFFDTLLGVPITYRTIFLGHKGFLTRLGIGSLVAGIASWLVKKPDRRFLISIGLMAVHATLYVMPGLEVFHDHDNFLVMEPIKWMGGGQFFDYYMIPFEAMSFSALAIAGTCFWDWLDKDDVAGSMKQRILPVAVYTWLACFVTSWFIPFAHFDLSVSQDLLALGMAYFLLVLFFCSEQFFKYKIPYLTAMGKNALILYIVGFMGNNIYLYARLYDFVTPESAWLGLVLCIGLVVPVGALAWMLDKHKMYLRF